MSGLTIKKIISRGIRKAGFITFFDGKDPSFCLVVFIVGEIRIFTYTNDVLSSVIFLLNERFKIAISKFRLPYIDSHTDYRRVTVTMAIGSCI